MKKATSLIGLGGILWLAIFMAGPLGRFQKSGLSRGRLPNPGLLSLLSFGNQALIADSVWVQNVQMLGRMDIFNAKKDQKRALALGAITASEIDPTFVFPLEAMGVVLSAWMHETPLARKLFLKGWFLAPQSWKFPFFLGFLAYFYEGDQRRAAEFLRRAALKDGCPPYITRLTAKLYTVSGRPEEGLQFLDAASSTESLAFFRPQIEERKKEILLTLAFEDIQKALEEYRKRFGKMPRDIEELKDLGLLGKLPKDPFGGDFKLDKDGRVFTTSGRRPLKLKAPHGSSGLRPLSEPLKGQEGRHDHD